MQLLINPTDFPTEESHFLIDGPVGHLELLTLPAKADPLGLAIICHPHPLYQGTMHNKVVTTLARAFHHLNCHTIRFNYRGVGKSAGVFGDSIGEFADLEAVLAWANAALQTPKLWLAGFSFGAYIAALGAAHYPCQQLFSVAPAIPNQPYATLPPIMCPWLVVQGENDEVIPPQAVYQWYDNRQRTQAGMKLVRLPHSSHFFHGNLVNLRHIIEENFIS